MDVIEEQFRMAEEQTEKLRNTSEEVKSQASSVMKVTLDWRLLLDNFASLENSLREQAKKIECWSERVEIKSKMVEERLSQVETRERESEAEVLDKKTRERKREPGLVEKELEGCNRKLATKRKQLSEVQKTLEAYNREVESKERRLGLAQMTTCESIKKLDQSTKDLKECEKSLSDKRQQLCQVENSLEGRNAELGNAERQLLLIQKTMEESLNKLNAGEKRLELVHKSIVDYSAELLKIEQSIKESSGNIKSEMDHLDSIKVQVRKKTKQLKDCSRELDGKEKRLEFVQKSTEDCSAELLRIQDSIKACSGNLRTEMDFLDSIKAQAQQQTKQLEAVESQYENMQKLTSVLSEKVKSKEKDLQSIERLSDKHLATDDTSLLSILSDGVHNIWSMKSKVSQTVVDLQDPAKMVLDLLNHVGFSASGIIARYLFLEQLMQVSPQVSSNVKEESIPLAFRWRSSFTLEDDENPMEVLAFLLFLIVYGMASSFSDKDILDLIMIIAQHKQAPEICRKLGFTNMMPVKVSVSVSLNDMLFAGLWRFTADCDVKKKHMEAARFICSFGLASEFPTEPLLKRYLENRRMKAWISRCELNSLEDVDWFMNRELETLRAISSFIKEFKLDFGSVAQRISDEIAKVEYDRASRMLCAPATAVHSVSCHAQGQNYHPGGISPRFQPQLQSQLQQNEERRGLIECSNQWIVSRASSQANLYDGAPYFDLSSGTPANYWQSSDSSHPPNRNTGAAQFRDPRRRHSRILRL